MEKQRQAVHDGGVEPQAFRTVMGRFATGVAIVTSQCGDQVAGITVNSLTSVSLRPPIILWCLDQGANRFAQFAEAARWGVSILAAEQEAVSNCFARSPAPFADEAQIERFDCHTPVMAGAAAQLACRTVDRRVLGDHLVIAGLVEGAAVREAAPLAYFAGRYAHLTANFEGNRHG
jgi:flavin reductase (DIM6/NTAB) family NADH-FMN oxidoreductase RutF